MLGEINYQTAYLTKEECEKLIQYYNDNAESAKRSITGYAPHAKVDYIKKISKTLSIKEPPESLQSAIEKVVTLAQHANEYMFLFDVDWTKPKYYIQEYLGEEKGFRSKSQSVNWISNHYQNKIVVGVILSDPSEYEGGDVIMNFGSADVLPTPEELRTQGTVYAFPAFRYWAVMPVLSGKKYHFKAVFQGPYWR